MKCGYYEISTTTFGMKCEYLLTNQFTGAWTHYTGTIQGPQTDHMVIYFQEILM